MKMQVSAGRGGALWAVLLVGAILAGCGAGDAVSSVPEENATGETAAAQGIVCLSEAPGIDGYASEAGYYHTVSRADASINLCYLDFATKQDIYLCSQPNCTHDNEACPAWIPFSNGLVRPIPVGDKVVILYGGNPSYADVVGDAALAKIETMNPDGSDRQTVVQFSATQQINQLPRGGLAKDDANVYFVLTETTTGLRTLYVFHLDSQTAEPLRELTEDEGRIYGTAGNALVMGYTPDANDMEADVSTLETQLYRFDLETRADTPLFSYPYASYVGFDGKLFGVLTEDGTLTGYDLNTGEAIYQNKVDLPDWDYTNFYGATGGHLLISELIMPDDSVVESGKPYTLSINLYAIDIRTGKRETLPYTYTRMYDDGYGEGKAYQVVSETATDYLCSWEKERVVISYQVAEGTNQEGGYTECSYVLIPKDGFWTGDATPVPVTEREA